MQKWKKSIARLTASILCVGTIPFGALSASAEDVAEEEFLIVREYADTATEDSSLVSSENAEVLGTVGTYGDLEYEVIEDGTLAITGCTDGITEAEIPSEIDGRTVTIIAQQAFYMQSDLERVVIPDTVTGISFGAFARCTKLEEITIPESVRYIGRLAFFATPWLAEREETGEMLIVNNILVDAMYVAGDVTIPDTVTAIAGGAFEDNYDLTSVTIPESVTEIGEYAFLNCTNLTTVDVPDSVTFMEAGVFAGCTGLIDATLPAGLTAIPRSTFSGCEALEQVTLPDTLTEIETCAFYQCSNFAGFALPEGLIAIGDGAFYGCNQLQSVVLPDSLESIGDSVYMDCENLEEITIPETLMEIGEWTFWNTPWMDAMAENDPLIVVNGMLLDGYHCTGDVVIPDGITRILGGAFTESKVTSITVPDSVTQIDKEAFTSCALLRQIYIPASVTSIGNYVYLSSPKLTDIYFGGTEEAWNAAYPRTEYGAEDAEMDAIDPTPNINIHYEATEMALSVGTEGTEGALSYYVQDDGTIAITDFDESVTELEIPSTIGGRTVTAIDAMAFYNYTSLTKVVIPDTVTTIGNDAFSGCTALAEIEIPESVVNFGICSFESTPWLEAKWAETPLLVVNNILIDSYDATGNVVIPDGIEKIAAGAFYGDEELESVVIPDSVTEIGDSAFCESGLQEITIPESVTTIGGEAFWDTPWLSARSEEDPLVVVNGILVDGDTASGAVLIPETVTTISDAAFYGNDQITSVMIPEGVTEIGQYAFAYCHNLNTVLCADSITEIGEAAFYRCTSLVEINLPSELTAIPDFMLMCCSSLFEISVPENVSSIGYAAFAYCDGLSRISIPATVATFGDFALANNPNLTEIYYGGSEDRWTNQYTGLEYNLDEDEEDPDVDPAKTAELNYNATGLPDLYTGDLDNNKEINADDAYLTLLAYANVSVGEPVGLAFSQQEAADINGDGTINAEDAYFILLYYANDSVGEIVDWSDIVK